VRGVLLHGILVSEAVGEPRARRRQSQRKVACKNLKTAPQWLRVIMYPLPTIVVLFAAHGPLSSVVLLLDLSSPR